MLQTQDRLDGPSSGLETFGEVGPGAGTGNADFKRVADAALTGFGLPTSLVEISSRAFKGSNVSYIYQQSILSCI
jgi:hypothetical protein